MVIFTTDLVVVAAAALLMSGDWNVRAFFWPAVAVGALWVLGRPPFNPYRGVVRWLFFAVPPVVLLLLTGAAWLLLMALES